MTMLARAHDELRPAIAALVRERLSPVERAVVVLREVGHLGQVGDANNLRL